MAIVVECPSCKKRYEVSEKLAGRKARCNACQGVLSIPTPAPAAEVDWARVVAASASAPAIGRRATNVVRAELALCPHCNSPVGEGTGLCGVCMLPLKKEPKEPLLGDAKAGWRESLWLVLGVLAALGSVPPFFVLLAWVFGPTAAYFICALEIDLMVGGIALRWACWVCREEQPEMGRAMWVSMRAGFFALVAGLFVLWLAITTTPGAPQALIMQPIKLLLVVFAPLLAGAYVYGVELDMPFDKAIGVYLLSRIFGLVLDLVVIVILLAACCLWLLIFAPAAPLLKALGL